MFKLQQLTDCESFWTQHLNELDEYVSCILITLLLTQLNILYQTKLCK